MNQRVTMHLLLMIYHARKLAVRLETLDSNHNTFTFLLFQIISNFYAVNQPHEFSKEPQAQITRLTLRQLSAER